MMSLLQPWKAKGYSGRGKTGHHGCEDASVARRPELTTAIKGLKCQLIAMAIHTLGYNPRGYIGARCTENQEQ